MDFFLGCPFAVKSLGEQVKAFCVDSITTVPACPLLQSSGTLHSPVLSTSLGPTHSYLLKVVVL